MIKPNKRILFAVECQQVADVVKSKNTGTIRGGHSWVIQANFPGMRNPEKSKFLAAIASFEKCVHNLILIISTFLVNQCTYHMGLVIYT
jgi:hypothetical protein